MYILHADIIWYMYIIQCILYTIQCTFYNVHYTLYRDTANGEVVGTSLLLEDVLEQGKYQQDKSCAGTVLLSSTQHYPVELRLISSLNPSSRGTSFALLTRITAAQNDVALSYHRVRALYFLAVVFAVTIYQIVITHDLFINLRKLIFCYQKV